MGPNPPENYIIKKQFDIDYYYRKLPSTEFPACENPGITSSICVPKDEVQDLTPFCHDVNYDFICVPVEHFLWPLWSIEEKDYQINKLVVDQVEQRLMLELANPMGPESIAVAGLELTSSMDCMDGYK